MRALNNKIEKKTTSNYSNSDYENYYKPFFNDKYNSIKSTINAPFIMNVKTEIVKRRILDRALWLYGKILNNNQQ